MDTSHQFILWILVFAYAMHILEEYQLDWRDWANASLPVEVSWHDFYLTNGCAMFAAIAAAMVGWRAPAFSLIMPATFVINGVFFHIGPTLIQRRLSPGVITSLLLYLPLGAWLYYGAWRDGVLSPQVLIISSLGGAAVMAWPIILLKLKKKLKPQRAE